MTHDYYGTPICEEMLETFEPSIESGFGRDFCRILSAAKKGDSVKKHVEIKTSGKELSHSFKTNPDILGDFSLVRNPIRVFNVWNQVITQCQPKLVLKKCPLFSG